MTQTIEVSHDDVVKIVVWDLIEKYISNIKRNKTEWSIAFEMVLRYYLSPEELAILRFSIANDSVPENPLELFDD